MINNAATLVVDVDGTICNVRANDQDYHELAPRLDIINMLHSYKAKGYYIILFTSRNMNTYKNNIGLINKFTAPVLVEWLYKHQVPFDELIFGKPWPNKYGFYIDDRAIRPNEFLSLSEDEIQRLIKNK